jgi:uncharacterized protein (DUF1501 family)
MIPHSSVSNRLSRRGLLCLGAGLSLTLMGGAGAFADPAQAERKLVVIVCRGAMDGISAAPPLGDPDYAALRGPIAIPAEDALPLDGYFALHPKLTGLHALAQSGQARIAPAVAIPQRIRSHFEAQDLLETGGDRLHDATTGWLNRTLAALGAAPGGRRAVTALSVGPQAPLILSGPVQAGSWSPGGQADGGTARIAAVLQELYSHDPQLASALATGLATEAEADALAASLGGNKVAADARGFAETTGKFLAAPDGFSIAVLSLTGFDTHAGQGASDGLLANRLAVLDQTVAGLRSGLGEQWGQAVVIAATEFGRTAHVNGTGGTDHGTASALILAGGALKPGSLVGDWPTLAASKLFEGRDLAPTLDIRGVFKGVLADHLGVDRAALDGVIFPGSRDAAPVQDLVRLG